MNRSWTQLWVAVIGMVGLVTVTGIAVTALVWGQAPERADLVIGMLAGGLVTVTGAAAAYLFRLNNVK